MTKDQLEKKMALVDHLLCTALSESKYMAVMTLRKELMAQYIVVFSLPELMEEKK